MKQLADIAGVHGITKHVEDTELYVSFQVGSKYHRLKVRYRPFSNFPIEFVLFRGLRYQVNNVSA